MIVAVVLWLIAAVGVVVFVGRAWSLGPLVAKGRGQLLRSGVDAVVALALVRALAPPPGPGSGSGWPPRSRWGRARPE